MTKLSTLDQAWQAWLEGRRRQAWELAETLLPEIPAARILLAQLSLDSGDLDAALSWLDPLPPYPEQAQIQAKLWLELNQPQRGLACLAATPPQARIDFALYFRLHEALLSDPPDLEQWPPDLSLPERIELLLHCLPQSRYPETISAWLEKQSGPAAWRCQLLHRLAQAWLHRGEVFQAENYYKKALQLSENQAESLWGLGVCAQEKGAWEAAESFYRHSLKLQPGLIAAHFNLGVLLLSRGEWQKGFQELEWRLQKKSRGSLLPRWMGQSLKNKTLLIQAEYGLGDQIQFWRFLPSVCQAAGRVLLEVPPALHGLANRLDLNLTLFTQGDPPPGHVDYTLPLLSLPHRLQINSTQEIRCLPPWKSTPTPERNAHQISLVWQGRQSIAQPAYQQLQKRKAIPSSLLTSFPQNFPEIQWWGLQPDLLPQTFPPGVSDPPVKLESLAITADWLNTQSLLLSIDSALIHLASSVGCPAWLLLPEPAPWIWPKSGTESPWYPNLRIFRQPQPGDWQGLLENVTTALHNRKLESSQKNDKNNTC